MIDMKVKGYGRFIYLPKILDNDVTRGVIDSAKTSIYLRALRLDHELAKLTLICAPNTPLEDILRELEVLKESVEAKIKINKGMVRMR